MTDSDRRWRTTTRRSALGLMSVGAAFFATETLGFTQLSADRGVNVAVADDLNAVLRIGVDEGQDGTFNAELTDEPFSGDTNVEFVNQSETAIDGDSDDGLTVEIDATDSDDGTSLDISNEENFDITDGTDATENIVTATTDLEAENGNVNRAVLGFNPDEAAGGDSPEADITVTATFADGTTLTLTREGIVFEEPQ